LQCSGQHTRDKDTDKSIDKSTAHLADSVSAEQYARCAQGSRGNDSCHLEHWNVLGVHDVLHIAHYKYKACEASYGCHVHTYLPPAIDKQVDKDSDKTTDKETQLHATQVGIPQEDCSRYIAYKEEQIGQRTLGAIDKAYTLDVLGLVEQQNTQRRYGNGYENNQ
jgi:hypothetical protein